jgi:hypothetical protein
MPYGGLVERSVGGSRPRRQAGQEKRRIGRRPAPGDDRRPRRPEPGRPITATGEIIDLSCYLQLGKHGEKHKACGTKCIQNSQPVGLLTKDGTVYMLMEGEHDPRRDGQTSFQEQAANDFAKIVEVTGTEAAHAGLKAIYVQGYVKK